MGANDREKRGADGGLHIETRQRFARTSPRDGGLRTGHGGLTETKVERFPREQCAGRAAPDAPAGCRRQDGTGHRGDHRLRQNLTEDVVRRATVRLPEGVEPWQIGRLRHADTRSRGVDLLERRPHRRVMVKSVLDRLIQGEDRWWR